jgi:tetrahydromethanopterin:alpha-L-glutamate ligase
MKRIGVIGIRGGWSSEQLADALEERTGFRRVIDLTQVTLDLERDRVSAGDLNLLELDGLVVKKLGLEYAPTHLDRLEILRYVQAKGVPVFSKAEKIGAVLDRLSCTVTLRLHDIPMPATVITEDVDAAVEAVERFGKSVFKPLFSTKARGMELIEAGPSTRERVQEFKDSGHEVMYIQKMQTLPGWDLGVAFLGGEYIGTYARVASCESWNTTHHAGGRYEGREPSEELIELARRAQEPFGLDFTCVDIAITSEGPIVFEVSAFGGFHGLKDGCSIDAAARIADYVLARV